MIHPFLFFQWLSEKLHLYQIFGFENASELNHVTYTWLVMVILVVLAFLASRGMKWIQRTGPETLNDDALRDYLANSHRLVASGLPKRVQKELGFNRP